MPYLDISYDDLNIRLFGYYDHLMMIIALVANVCISLPALIWAFHVFYTVRKRGGQISAFIILLIINDLAELLLSVITASYAIDSFVKSSAIISLKKITEERYIYSWNRFFRLKHFSYFFVTFRTGGLYLHQLVALKHILSLKNQLCSDHVFSPLCSTFTSIILWLLAYGCQFLDIWVHLVFSFLPCCFLAITCILTCKASPAPEHVKPGSAVLIVSTLTLITFCTTAGLRIALDNHRFYYYRMSLPFSSFMLSLRVISDPLLCVLVCKEKLRIHKQQTHTELNTDERSV